MQNTSNYSASPCPSIFYLFFHNQNWLKKCLPMPNEADAFASDAFHQDLYAITGGDDFQKYKRINYRFIIFN